MRASIGKTMPSVSQRVLIALLTSMMSTPCAFAQPQRPWWVTAGFEPFGTQVEGVALSRLDSSWIAATALTDYPLPDDVGETIADLGGGFEAVRDLTGDGHTDKAIVGVYRTQTDELGRFLLVLTGENEGTGSGHSLLRLPGKPGLSWLRTGTDELQWWFCLRGCDHMCTVVATKSEFECRFPHIGPEGPCTTFATESGLECRYARDESDQRVAVPIPVAAGLEALVATPEGRHYHAQLEREPLDPLWGPVTEARLMSFFAEHTEVMRYGAPEVHCRSVTCEIQYVGYGLGSMETTDWIRFLEPGLRDRSWAKGLMRVGVVTGERDGASAALWYLSTRLPDEGERELQHGFPR